jgi:hypothetical protein
MVVKNQVLCAKSSVDNWVANMSEEEKQILMVMGHFGRKRELEMDSKSGKTLWEGKAAATERVGPDLEALYFRITVGIDVKGVHGCLGVGTEAGCGLENDSNISIQSNISAASVWGRI